MQPDTSEDGGLYRLRREDRAARRWRGLDFELTPQQELACAFRIIAGAGANLDMTGHITMVANENGDMWCNPWGIWWDEIRASDIIMVDKDGNQLDGRWGLNPAIYIHTEVHQRRGALGKVAVHNHPHYGILLGTMGVIPDIIDQQSCALAGEIGLNDEYSGAVATLEEGVEFADDVGERSAVMLKNHGCLVTAPDIRQATFKAVMFERLCRLTYESLSAGVKPDPVPKELQTQMKPLMLRYAANIFWEGAVRQLIARDPDVVT